MEVRLTVYHAREGQRVVWVPLGLGAHGGRFEASHENKLRDQLAQHYRELLRNLPLPEAARFELTPGARPLRRVIEERVIAPVAAYLAAHPEVHDCVLTVGADGSAVLG